MKHKFLTLEKKQEAIKVFDSLRNNPDWKMVVELLNYNIDLLKTKIQEGVSRDDPGLSTGKRLAQEDSIRDRIGVYTEMVNLPEKMIRELHEEEDKEVADIDPYYNPEDIKKLREQKN